MIFEERCEQEHRPVTKIVAVNWVLDPIDQLRSLSLELDFLLIGIQPSSRKPGARSDPTHRVRQPTGEVRRIIECQQPVVRGGDGEVALVSRHSPERHVRGVYQRTEHSGRDALRTALRPDEACDDVGPASREP